MTVYVAKLKTRKELEKDRYRIPGVWGWWADICPGKTLRLRIATAADLARCRISDGWSTLPEDYYCELPEDGCLVSKVAIKSVVEESA